MNIGKLAALAALGLAVLAAPAAADVVYDYQWNRGDTGVNDAGGVIKSVQFTYNETAQELTVLANTGGVPGSTTWISHGFQFAISPGPNPKGHAGELAFFYMDNSKATGPILTTYAYNGNSSLGHLSYSWPSPVDRIQSSLLDPTFVKSFTEIHGPNRDTWLGFTIDASAINSHIPMRPGSTPWTGAAFGDQIGIWFHPWTAFSTSYSGGWLSHWSGGKRGWLDTAYRNTTKKTTNGVIPEPSTVLLLGLGTLGLVGSRLRRKKKLEI